MSDQFQIGDMVVCRSKPSFLKHLHLKKGDKFIITDVARGEYSDLLNLRRLNSEVSLLIIPMIPSRHFERILA